MPIDRFVSTTGTNTLYNISNVLHFETFGNMNLRNHFVFETNGFATDGARQMNMLVLVNTIFLLSAPIVKNVQQIIFDKKRQSTE